MRSIDYQKQKLKRQAAREAALGWRPDDLARRADQALRAWARTKPEARVFLLQPMGGRR